MIRQSDNFQAELSSMNGIIMDSTRVLKEKLSLSHELATLKPELEHLRSQAEYQQAVLAEKLALQRQVSTLEVELETEKRALKRAAQKNNNEKEAELQSQLDELQKDLARCKRESEKARKEAERDFQTQIEELQKDLARLKREGEKSRKEGEKELEKVLKRASHKNDNNARDAELQHQVEKLQKDLVREKKESERVREEAEKELENERRALKRATQNNDNSEREAELHELVEKLKKDLIRGQKEAEKIRKEAEKDLRASETAQTILESKLEQVRIKLRSTKDELKECQAELSQTRAGVVKGKSVMKEDAPPKNPRKRGALEMSTDVTIGTPDGVAVRGKRPATKKGRADQTMVGEKSMFSITPFLNRTVNTAPESPAQGDDTENKEENLEAEQRTKMMPLPAQLAEAAFAAGIFSPTAAPRPRGKKKSTQETSLVDSNILGESKASIKNTKLTAKKPRTMGTLEKVTEEEVDENEQPAISLAASSKNASENIWKPTDLKASKAPKTIEAEEAGPKKKKRKLLGGGKTLFDEEDAEATKRPAKIALGPPRILGKGGLGGPKTGLKGGVGAPSGFGAFSPLKKDRRGVGASFLA
jgi:hypothetical protein